MPGSSVHTFALLLLCLLPAALLGVALLQQIKRNRDLQSRNDSLSDTLTQVVQTSSDERLALTKKHADEREKLRTECMLQLDSMQRNITASFTEMLLAKLKELPTRSRSGRSVG